MLRVLRVVDGVRKVNKKTMGEQNNAFRGKLISELEKVGLEYDKNTGIKYKKNEKEFVLTAKWIKGEKNLFVEWVNNYNGGNYMPEKNYRVWEVEAEGCNFEFKFNRRIRNNGITEDKDKNKVLGNLVFYSILKEEVRDGKDKTKHTEFKKKLAGRCNATLEVSCESS